MSLTFTDPVLTDDIVITGGTKPVDCSDILYEDFSTYVNICNKVILILKNLIM